MAQRDVRWQQRFQQFLKAHAQLADAVALMDERPLSNLEKQGVIQAFEFTYELGWNTLKDYLIWQGLTDIVGSRDTIRESYSVGLIEDGEAWMAMLVDRNRTSHTYNEATAEAILMNIKHSHFSLLERLKQVMVLKA